MPLDKSPININFAQGLDTKADPKQVQVGKFLKLTNSVFGKTGMLQKRNGYAPLASLANDSSLHLTTLNGNLTAIGDTIQAYINGSSTWVQKGTMQPLALQTLPLIRNNLNQVQADCAISPNNLVCTVYTETDGSTTTYKYAVADSITGQNIIAPSLIPSGANTVIDAPRVFTLGNYFIIVFTVTIGGTSHLQYVAFSAYSLTTISSPRDLASAYTPSNKLSWGAVTVNNNLYFAYDTTTGGQSIHVSYLSAAQAAGGLAPVTATIINGEIATTMALTADTTNSAAPIIYAAYYDSASSVGKTFAVDQNLNVVMQPTPVITSGTVLNVVAAAQNGVLQYVYEVANTYGYDTSIPTNYVASYYITKPNTVTTGTVSPTAGAASAGTIVLRSVGLASKAFIIEGKAYALVAYQSTYQPTYFLVNLASTAASPIIVGKLAYENGGGYLPTSVPNAVVNGNTVSFPYLYKDLIAAVNKGTALPTGTQVDGIYSQTGLNLATFTFDPAIISTAEAASSLQISGGFLWQYDGYLPVEQNFFLWPDNVEATWSTTGGNVAAQPDGATNTNAYYYQVTYEWSDNQGNIHRSAPSIPVSITTTGSGTTGSVVLHVPTLRLTYKTANPVKIVIYRWSVAQEVYYQVTSLSAPLLNSTTADYVTFTDTSSDATILGNNIIYTTGGVVEDLNAPASEINTLFDNRFWLVDAEDQNLLWFSKLIIESTPVEMSDLFTMYIAPSIGVQGNTGPVTALAAMDDKLIIFKQNAAYYVNGTGPDATGANSQYSQPIFITSTVGCTNPRSIVLMQNGLMFQSDKGIWLLGRDLSTQYIGAPVEEYNSATVLSVVNVPETTQIRFTLDSGITLLYDYYFQQWGTFENVPAVSSCIFNSLHTYVDAVGQVYQESPGLYLDNDTPVLMSFTTSWMNLAGLQGYERFYFGYLLGTYYTPFMLNLQIAYDYNNSPSQAILITPDNYSLPWGGEANWGAGAPWGGGPGNVFEARFFPQEQKCSSFQITVQEIYDRSYGSVMGQGLSLSGLNLEVGMKRGYRTSKASRSFG